MKKIVLFLIMAAVLSLPLAGTASAFSFNFHGSMLNTMTSTNNTNTLKNELKSGTTDVFSSTALGKTSNYWKTALDEGDTTQYAKTKVRLRFEGTTDDGRAKIVYGFEGGGYYWGDNNFDLSGDSTTTETRFAYAQLSALNGKFTAGLQKTGLNQWVWTETASGLKYQTDINDWKFTAAWFRGYDAFGRTNKVSTNNNDDFFFLKADGKVNENLKLGFFGLYDNLKQEIKYASNYSANYYWLGITGKFKTDKIFGNFDAIYNGGTINPDKGLGKNIDRDGYLGNLTVGYKVNDKFKVSLNGLYVSGDDNPNDSNADNFDSVDVDIKCGIVLFTGDSLTGKADNFVSDGPLINDKGLINIALQGTYKIDAKNKVRAAIRKLYSAEDLDYIAGKKKDNDIGYEFDLWYSYKFNKNVALKAEFGYLVTGDGADQLTADGHADSGIYQASAGMVFKF